MIVYLPKVLLPNLQYQASQTEGLTSYNKYTSGFNHALGNSSLTITQTCAVANGHINATSISSSCFEIECFAL